MDGEKVDYIEYSDDLETMVRSCLKPATIEHFEHDDNGKVKVTIPEHQKAMAIGKGASNIRLASKLCSVAIEIV